MLIQSVLLFGLTLLISSQKYPNCPGGVPIDIGNTSDLYFERVLDLTGFMDYHDSGSLVSAFEDYGRTGSSSKVDDVVHQNRTFYIIVLVIMGCTTLMLFIVMLRMGDFKLGKREVFDKLKGQGFSSPLSAFFTLVAVILLVSSCLTAYLLA